MMRLPTMKGIFVVMNEKAILIKFLKSLGLLKYVSSNPCVAFGDRVVLKQKMCFWELTTEQKQIVEDNLDKI